MKCLKCEGEMEKGVMADYAGDVGERNEDPEWGSGTNWLGMLKEKKKVVTYRCTKCGYLESYAK